MKTRAEAKAAGDKFYGSPCERCGTSKRRVDSGSCVQCAKDRRKRAYQKEKEQRGHGKFFQSFCSACKKVTKHYKSNGNCVACSNKRSLDHYQRNRDDYLSRFRDNYHNNKEERRAAGKEWYRKNRHRLRSYYAKYREANKDKIKAWRTSESAMERHRERQRNKYKTPAGKAEMALRNMVYRVLKAERCGSAVSQLGYLPSDLVKHIENQFKKGMSWDNYGEWHIDHVCPVSLFLKNGITNPELVNALQNLQPMWAKENISKLDNFNGCFASHLKKIKESLC